MNPLRFFTAILPLVAAAFSLTGRADGALVANWKAETYTSGTWTDTVSALPAAPVNAPSVVTNAFGTRKGINCGGTGYFTVASGSNPLAGKTSFTLAAVFKATSAGTTGTNWYQASGLIGAEQGGVTNDFGLGWTGDTGGAVKGGAGFSGLGDRTVTSAAQALNTVHAAVMTYNGPTGVLTLFVNGVQVATATGTVNAARNAATFGLGAMSTATTAYQPFPGIIGELQMYDSVEDGVALSNSLRNTYLSPQLITSFTANKASAYEGESVQFSWAINTAPLTGSLSVTIRRGATTIYTGSSASGTFNSTIPDLAGTAQSLAYTLTATEVGGGGLSDSKQVSIAADPGIPTANAQSGLTVQQPNPLNITLGGIDPNGGTLTYSLVTPPVKGGVGIVENVATFTPAAGMSGADSFTFKVSDGKYESAVAKVSVTINPVATAPSGIALDSSVVADTAVSGTFIAKIASTDINFNDAHTYALVAGTGATDNARFTISGHQLRAAQSFAGLAGGTFSIRLRSTDSTALTVEQVFTLSCATPTRGVVINEVLYNGVDNTVRDEFIELYNAGTVTVNLTGWRLSSAVDYDFPANTMLAAGAYLIVAQDPATISARFGKAALGPWTGSLSSKGETIRLRDAGDVIVSEADYKPGFPWPTSADGDGTSMELINPKLDEGLGSNWRAATIPALTATTDTATPGAQNLKFAANAPPAIRQVNHSPTQPTSGDPIVITAKVTDPDGVASVQLLYQSVAPGAFIPSTLPRAISGGQFTSTALPLPDNPAFESAANWTTVAMNDDGLGADAQGGDGIYTATIPFQPNRTLVRYRIVVADNLGVNVRVPYTDDPSLNFACFVYDGVPAYQGSTAAVLTALQTYHFLTRGADYDQCVAYNVANQLSTNTPSWTFENWEAAFVSDGVVRDHILYRLHGANGRYGASGVAGAAATSKRAFKFIFNKGAYFQGRDNDGKNYPGEWKTMITENCWENRATYTFSLNEAVNFYIWNQLGVPAPFANFAHFRTVKQSAEQPDAWHGDFWGLMFVHEDYDGRFLDAHNLPKGNLYKLTKDGVTGVSQQRYQAEFAPKDGSDHDDLKNNLRGTSTPAYITGRVNLDLWARYHAFAEAIRHYDYWPSGDNNAAWYFYPDYSAANGNKGTLWWMPNDVDATWGPTWNNGRDLVHNSLFNDTPDAGGDASTNPTLWARYYNQVREVRDLLWQPEQINPLIDQFAAVIQPFVNADFARWYGAPSDAGNFAGLAGFGMSSSVGQTSLAAYVAGMKDFAFDADNNGSTWPGGNVGAGGRAAFLEAKQAENGEGTQIPNTPAISFAGSAGYPVNDLRFQTTAFSDPQGSGTFSAVQWRIAEVNPTAVFTPGVKRLLEINASYDSGAVAFTSQFRFPAASAVAGRTYRARVRHADNTGRWSRWSAPAEFTAAAADVSVYLQSLVVSKVMYRPSPPTAAETALGYTEDSFEYLEVRNVSATTLDLSDVRFTKGVNFDFAVGQQLAAGASLLVVNNIAAFNYRYGAGKPVAGAWQAGKVLSNSGEQVKLSFGAGTSIVNFTYSAAAPWPTQAAGQGYSLVLIRPETLPNPALAASWRASRVPGGNPGADDRITFSTWAAGYPGAADPNADIDGDMLTNFTEYAVGSDPTQRSANAVPVAVQSVNVSGVVANYLTIGVRRQIGAEDVTYYVEFSDDLAAPWSGNGVLVSSAFNGDGTITEVWRAATPASATLKCFARLRVTNP